MADLFQAVLTASFHGSIVICVVLLLRLMLRKASRKYVCYLWLLAGIRLLMPFRIQSELSLQPLSPPVVIPFSWWMSLLWLLIAASFAFYSFFSYIALRKKVRQAVKIPGGWESEWIDTAFILGFVKPQIYIPRGISADTRKHILAHERTHLDKGDHWIKMIGFLALALHWFNPLVWVAYILLCKDIEIACDERVVQFMELKERKEYSAALLNCSSNPIHYAASPVAFGEVNVKNRILSILRYRKPSFCLGLVSVVSLVFVMVCLVTSPIAPATHAVQEPTVEVPVAAPPGEPVSDWGFHMIAQVHSPTAMTLYAGVGVPEIPWDGSLIHKDHSYWLERWDGEVWEKLPLLVEDPKYEGSSSTDFSRENICGYYLEDSLDWTLLYGPLKAGYYRIGVNPTRNGETIAHYAQFRIWTNVLSAEEAEAIARCETALDLLTQKNSYSVTLYETNPFGNLMPVRELVKSKTRARIDSYVGEICYNSYYCDMTEEIMNQWDDEFRLNENKRILFPEGESCIREDTIQFVTEWEDADGTAWREVNIYSFGPDGILSGAERIRRHTGLDGTETVRHRKLLVSTAHTGDVWYSAQAATVSQPRDSQSAAQDSPWGIFFRVDDDYLSPAGGEVWFSVINAVGVVNYTTDSAYWLEKWEADHWDKLVSQGGDPVWGSEAYRLSSRTTVIDRVDWSPYYGQLKPGLYRMGKHFYNGEESIIQYAEFMVYVDGAIVGSGGEAAMLRVNQAIERVCAGSYHITCEENGSYRVPAQVSTVFWKHDGICVTDYYDYQRYDGYRHSSLTQDASDPYFYDMWKSYLWYEPRDQIYFAEGASKISDSEISFAVAVTGDDWMYPLIQYSVFFDEAGDITKIVYSRPDLITSGSERKTTFTFLDTSEAEITAWVQKIQQEYT